MREFNTSILYFQGWRTFCCVWWWGCLCKKNGSAAACPTYRQSYSVHSGMTRSGYMFYVCHTPSLLSHRGTDMPKPYVFHINIWFKLLHSSLSWLDDLSLLSFFNQNSFQTDPDGQGYQASVKTKGHSHNSTPVDRPEKERWPRIE